MHSICFSFISTTIILCSFGNVLSCENPRVVTKITPLPNSKVSVLGEAPYFSEEEQALYYVDIRAGDIIRYDVVIGTETKVQIGGFTSVIIPIVNEPGNFIVTSGGKLLKLNFRRNETELITELGISERFNDGKCDAMGRLFIGAWTDVGGVPAPNGSTLYRLDGNSLTKVAEGFLISNGMGWSNDASHEIFYLNDSEDRKIYAFNYNITNGSLSNKRVIIDCDTHPDFMADEKPDGMAMDQFGFIWTALWGGERVVKINPETARVVDEIKLPRVKIPTSLAFGRYKGEFGFYMTTASIGIDPIDLMDGGKLHHVSFQGGDVRGFNPDT